MATITSVTAREILDSRGNPTVEATITLNDGTVATAATPSGASVSSYEAIELRDNDQKRYLGKGVLTAVNNVNTILAPQLLNMDPTTQQAIDQKMIAIDGTENKGKLGANGILAVSMAVTKAAAKTSQMPLYQYIRTNVIRETGDYKMPIPMFNIINGGKHAEGSVDMQEFMVIPASFKKFHEGLELGVTVTKKLKEILKENNLTTLVGDEGGFGPSLATNEEPLSLIAKAIEAATLRTGYDAYLGIDAASGSFYSDKKYKIKGHNSGMSGNDLIQVYQGLLTKYPILYLEDPLSEDDWEAWSKMFHETSKDTLIVGDDLTSTNPFRLQMAIEKKAISGIIIKPNQIGTVSEAAAVVAIARAAGIKIIVSHRSGETNDDFIADFAIGVRADYVKFGAPIRGERLAKYNRLLAIETELTALAQNQTKQ